MALKRTSLFAEGGVHGERRVVNCPMQATGSRLEGHSVQKRYLSGCLLSVKLNSVRSITCMTKRLECALKSTDDYRSAFNHVSRQLNSTRDGYLRM